MNTEWITDRLPTAEDALTDGSVWTFYDGKVMMWSYDGVELGTPWQRIPTPEPYVKPKRWTVKRNNHHDEWYLYDGEKEWDRLDGRLTQDAAQRICDIYNEVMP
jgi:hypothetical protein